MAKKRSSKATASSKKSTPGAGASVFMRLALPVMAVAVVAGLLLASLIPSAPHDAVPLKSPEDLFQEGGQWTFNCVDSFAGGEACVPSICGRQIIDDFLSASETAVLVELMEQGLSFGSASGPPSVLDLTSGAVSHKTQFISVYEAMNAERRSHSQGENAKPAAFPEQSIRLYQTIADRARQRIERDWNVTGLYLTAPSFFNRVDAGKPARTIHDEYGSFVYSALIYLNDHGTDFEGGEFNFIDSPEGGGGDEERKENALLDPPTGRTDL